MKKIKIAQIGTGHDHASGIFRTLCKMQDVFEVVGYAKVPEDDLDSEWTKKTAEKLSACYQNYREYSVDEILAMSDLDAVAIETFDLNLVKYAQMAVDKGLHIHIDKAPGESAEEYEKLLATIKEKKLAFSIGYMYRFNPSIQRVFEEHKKGEYGKIHSIDAEMSGFYQKDKRDWLGYLQGGMMQYLGCHLIDLVVRLMGTPEEIIPINRNTGYQGTTGKDCCLTVLSYPNGVATVKCGMGDYGGFARRHFVVNGEKRSAEIRPLEKLESSDKLVQPLSSSCVAYTSEVWDDEGERINSDIFDRHGAMMKAFAEQVRGERVLEVDLETEASVHRCLLTACGIPCDYKAKIKL